MKDITVDLSDYEDGKEEITVTEDHVKTLYYYMRDDATTIPEPLFDLFASLFYRMEDIIDRLPEKALDISSRQTIAGVEDIREEGLDLKLQDWIDFDTEVRTIPWSAFADPTSYTKTWEERERKKVLEEAQKESARLVATAEKEKKSRYNKYLELRKEFEGEQS